MSLTFHFFNKYIYLAYFVSADVLGKVYGVVARRRGRIIAEEMKEGTTFFLIKTRLPIIDSFGFAEGIFGLLFCLLAFLRLRRC